MATRSSGSLRPVRAREEAHEIPLAGMRCSHRLQVSAELVPVAHPHHHTADVLEELDRLDVRLVVRVAQRCLDLALVDGDRVGRVVSGRGLLGQRLRQEIPGRLLGSGRPAPGALLAGAPPHRGKRVWAAWLSHVTFDAA